MSSRSHQNLGKESVVPRGFYVTYDKTDPQHNNQIASERGEELFYSYPLEQNDICNECGSMEIDGVYKRNFDINVCTNCVQLKSEKYKLITKTTAKELYLLTDEELCDQGALPFILKPNPLNPSWSEMQLYLSMHVDDFAKKKWGSLDALEQEINCREARKGVQQEKRFNKRLLGKQIIIFDSYLTTRS